MQRHQTARRDLWPLKAFGAACAIFFGGAGLSFPGDPTPPSILLLVGLLLIFDSLNDRDMQKVEQRWADEDRAAKAVAEQARAEREAAEMEAHLKERRRDFRAGKDLGFYIACYSSNKDLLKIEGLSDELRQRMEIKQREIMARIDALSRQFKHLNVPDEA